MGGGLPAAVLTEFVGAEGSGRTTAALACVAAIMQAGSVCAWIDVNDVLDPETVAANGIDLERLLWVRCGSAQATSHAASEALQRMYDPVPSSATQQRHTGGGSPHPRSEGRDMPQAISAMLHEHGGLYDHQMRREKRAIGTPGVPNRPLAHRSEGQEEQVASDRLPPRRGENLAVAPRCAEPQARRVASVSAGERLHVKQSTTREMSKNGAPWKALDQALRAADLLLQSGGFSVIVLDLGSVRPEFAWRIPLATWFRFRTACERTRASLILLTQHPCARSSAELVVRLQPGIMKSQSKVMTGIHYCAAIERSRSKEQREERVVPIRKPPQPERPGEWTSEASWARAK